METYRLLEKLKEGIQRDFRHLEERCNKAENDVQCLEKENIAAKELTSQLQSENDSLKRHLARLQKELAYMEEKLTRKTEDSCKIDHWWKRYQLASERSFKAMKDHGTFPPRILEKFVHRNIVEQMKDIPEDYSSLKDNESSKKHRNLTTLKCKKKVRYDKVSSATSNTEENKDKYSRKDYKHLFHEGNNQSNNFEENVFSDPNESTKLYHNGVPEQGHDVEVLGSNELSVHQKILVPETEEVPCSPQQEHDNVPVADKVNVHPEVLVPDTEDPYVEEVYDGLHCSIGAPSAASTPLTAANSPLFGYDIGDANKEVSVGILDSVSSKSPCNDTVNLLTAAKSQLAHLPKSDSQFPVDLSYTQPQSPTIPSRTQSLNQDMNLTADCSVSLLPHGMRNEEGQSRTDNKIEQNAGKESDNSVFMNMKTDKQTDLKRDRNVVNNTEKSSQQTTLDGELLKVKASTEDKDTGGCKRKRRSSGEADNTMWPIEGKNEQPSNAVFKVPVMPPPRTPEVILLEEFASHVTRKKSCTTPLSSNGDITELNNGTMDQSADLFANIDDCHSLDLHGEEKDVPLENSQKENLSSNKNRATKPDFKYVEVVRKRDERAKLNGYKCRECEEYYQGLNLPEEELKKRLKHCSRHRARFSPPPSTPPGFWNLSFPDTQEYMDKGYLKTESEVPAPKRLRRTRRSRIAK